MATKLKASSKFGRNKVKCDKYKATGRREKNKARKQATIARRLARAAEARENWVNNMSRLILG